MPEFTSYQEMRQHIGLLYAQKPFSTTRVYVAALLFAALLAGCGPAAPTPSGLRGT